MRLFVVIAAICLCSCTSESSLRFAPPVEGDGLGGGSGGGAPGAGSPWAGLEPGQIPDDLFAVAWAEPGTSSLTPARYDVIDALGRVVTSFSIPFEWEGAGNPPLYVRGVHATGPGRFLVVNDFSMAWDAPQRVVWEADAYDETSTVLAHFQLGTLELPLAGRTLAMSGEWSAGEQTVLPDPADPDRILIVPEVHQTWAESLLAPQSVVSLHVRDPDAPDRSWPLADLIPPELTAPEGEPLPSAWMVSLAADGSGRLVLGAYRYEEVDSANGKATEIHRHHVALAVDLDAPTEEPWILDLTGLTAAGSPLVAPPAADRPALAVLPTTTLRSVILVRDGVVSSLELPDGLYPIPRALLDVASTTFIYSAWVEGDEGPTPDRLVIVSEGQEVWSLDRFADGLASRPFSLGGFAHVRPD